MKFFHKKLIVGIVLIVFLFTIFIQFPASSAQSPSTPPTLYSTGNTETTISLEWTAAVPPTLNSMNNYTVYWSTQGTNGPFQILGVYSPSVQVVPLYGLTPSTHYWFKVIANWGNLFGSSYGQSNTLEASTNQDPSLQYSSVTQTTVSLSWIDYNSYSNLTTFQSYTVQTMGSSGSWSTLTTISTESDNSYTVTGLSSGTSYSFRIYDSVSVVNVSGTFDSYSNTVVVSTISQISATISTSSTSMEVGNNLQITLTVNGGVSPFSYQWYVNGNPVNGATSSSFTFSPTSAGTYSIYVTVTGSSGASQNSNTLTITVNNNNSVVGPSNNPFLSSILFWVIIIVIVVAVVAAVVIIIAKNRKGK